MDGSETPPDSATTARESLRRTFDGAKDDNVAALGKTSTLQDKRERDYENNDKMGQGDDEDDDEPPIPLERSHTYVREFWKFHMRAADDDEEQ